jgi:hypothetical protein
MHRDSVFFRRKMYDKLACHLLLDLPWPNSTILLPFFPTSDATHLLLSFFAVAAHSPQNSSLLFMAPPFSLTASSFHHHNGGGDPAREGDDRTRCTTGCSPECGEAAWLSSPSPRSSHNDGAARNMQRQRSYTTLDTWLGWVATTMMQWGTGSGRELLRHWTDQGSHTLHV